MKRAFDIFASATLIAIFSPLILIISLLIRRDGGSAIYRHVRIGQGGRPFACLKLRSMVVNGDATLKRYLAANPAEANQWALRRKLDRDPRVTGIGRFLRSTSLDELPQLFNVLRGDMSLVGPRPVVAEELDRYYGPAGRAAYVSVKPGVTGLWQVSGRSETSYSDRVALDTRYVLEQSFVTDIRLLLLTVPAVLRRRGAV